MRTREVARDNGVRVEAQGVRVTSWRRLVGDRFAGLFPLGGVVSALSLGASGQKMDAEFCCQARLSGSASASIGLKRLVLDWPVTMQHLAAVEWFVMSVARRSEKPSVLVCGITQAGGRNAIRPRMGPERA